MALRASAQPSMAPEADIGKQSRSTRPAQLGKGALCRCSLRHMNPHTIELPCDHGRIFSLSSTTARSRCPCTVAARRHVHQFLHGGGHPRRQVRRNVVPRPGSLIDADVTA